MYRNHSPSDFKSQAESEDLGPEVKAQDEPSLWNIEEARIDALNFALDRILPRVTSEHVFREECPCRWCYRQRDLRAREAVAQ